MNKISAFLLIIISSSIIALTRYPLPIVSLLIFIAYIPLYHFLMVKRSGKEILLAGTLFGAFYNIIALHWISLVTLPGYLGMFFLFTAYFSLSFLLINRISEHFKKIKPLIFILFFISFEYLQNFGEFSFPWFNAGYSLAEHLTLIQIADIGGVFFISFMILVVNMLIYQLIKRFNIYRLLMLFLIFGIWISYGKYRLNTLDMKKTTTDISVIQGDIDLDIKWNKAFMDSSISIYKELTLKSVNENSSSLSIWPESAVTYYLLKDYKIKHNLSNFAIKNKTNIFTGFQDYKPAPGENPEGYKFYNAASQITRKGIIQKPYYKKNLVPFGERMPFLKIFPILWKVQMGQANFERGEHFTTFKLDDKYKYSSVICFEIAFPLFIRKFEGIDFLVNLTNDAWFHRSVGTYQHAVMAKFRAIEIRKQVFRAANTGYSLIVLPTGEILKSTDLYEKRFIHSNLFVCKEKTLFTKILYLFPFTLLLLSGIIFVVYLKKIIIG